MSERCTFYRTDVRTVRANAIRPGVKEGPPKRLHVAYCGHAASPVPRRSDKVLNCMGDLALCPIADKL